MSHILTISGPRGGSGKSVTALNLSVSMGLYKKKVLLVDCDPLGSVSEYSGVRSMGYPFDLASVLGGRASLIEAVSKTEFSSLDVLPAGFNLFELSLKLSKITANEKILRLLMEDIRGDYDFIVMDCPSSWGFLSIAALTAADRLVVSMSAGTNWVEDFHTLLKSIRYIRQTHDTGLKIDGISLNRLNETNSAGVRLSGKAYAGTRELIYENTIPLDRTVDEAVSRKTPLVLYDVNSPAARAYLGLAREIILGFN